MAYRITATTDKDQELLDALRTLARRLSMTLDQRVDVSQLIREAFLQKIYGGKAHWPEEWR